MITSLKNNGITTSPKNNFFVPRVRVGGRRVAGRADAAPVATGGRGGIALPPREALTEGPGRDPSQKSREPEKEETQKAQALSI